MSERGGAMSLRWLSSMVGGKRMARPGIRHKMAPQAQRDLLDEIDADVVPVRRVWARDIVVEPGDGAEPEITVVARVNAEARPEVAAWLDGSDDANAEPDVRTDWIFFPATPEAILIGAVGGAEGEGPSFRVNLRFPADRYRRQLAALAESGLLGLTTVPLQVGPERELESPCVFVEIQTGPLREFLRELPPVPVV
jgi:hypothetical protein